MKLIEKKGWKKRHILDETPTPGREVSDVRTLCGHYPDKPFEILPVYQDAKRHMHGELVALALPSTCDLCIRSFKKNQEERHETHESQED